VNEVEDVGDVPAACMRRFGDLEFLTEASPE
jgi:hypothetical protein